MALTEKDEQKIISQLEDCFRNNTISPIQVLDIPEIPNQLKLSVLLSYLPENDLIKFVEKTSETLKKSVIPDPVRRYINSIKGYLDDPIKNGYEFLNAFYALATGPVERNHSIFDIKVHDIAGLLLMIEEVVNMNKHEEQLWNIYQDFDKPKDVDFCLRKELKSVHQKQIRRFKSIARSNLI